MRPTDVLKEILPPFVVRVARRSPELPDGGLYRSWLHYERVYSPWFGDAAFVSAFESGRPFSTIDVQRSWMLWSLVRQCLRLDGGELIEAGVFRGGSALLIWQAMQPATDGRRLHLFDSFAGLPAPGPNDVLEEGRMSDTSLDRVAGLFDDPRVVIHPGWIPATFTGSGVSSIGFAHVDLDLERGMLDACEFIYPRLLPGGVIVFDDYGQTCCPGARIAVDDFFRDLPEVPLVLPTGQAVVVKLP
jgi:O-methyltransferase